MTDNLGDLADEDLLTALHESREHRTLLEQEIEARFVERTTGAINTARFAATRRTDTTKYVFTEANMLLLAATVNDEDEWQRLKDAGRQIGRPFVSLSLKGEQA